VVSHRQLGLRCVPFLIAWDATQLMPNKSSGRVENNVVCPESTIDSFEAGAHSSALKLRKGKISEVCESTIESSATNRRDFVRKAALATAAVGIGGAVLGRNLAPQSSASSNTNFCCVLAGYNVYVDANGKNTGCSLKPGLFFGNCASGEGITSTRCCGVFNKFGINFYTGHCIRMVITNGGEVGIGLGNSSVPTSTLQVGSSGLAICGTSSSTESCAVAVSGIISSTSPGVEAIAVLGKNKGTGHNGIGVYGWQLGSGIGVYGYTPNGVGVYGDSGCTGVYSHGEAYGVQACSPGVAICALSISGTAVQGFGAKIGVAGMAFDPSGIPIVAIGQACQYANLQQWERYCGESLSAVNKCGWFGIGTSSPSTPLDVTGSSPLIGTIKNTASSGDRSSLVQFSNGDSTPDGGVDWNIGVAGLCNSIKVPDGFFYVQHSASTTPGISVNKCNHVGIGLSNPCRVLCVNGRIHTSCGMGLGTQTINTTLAINGSLSMKSRQVKSATTLSLSDYTVLANASTAAFTITLPAVSSTAGACNGMVLFIKKIDSSTNAVTVSASGTDTIEGNASIKLSKQYDSLQLVSNNSSGTHEWFILQSGKCGAFLS
jgi:hypothetical protein